MVSPWLPKAGLCPDDGEVLGRKQEGQVGESHRPWLPCGSQETSLGAEGWQVEGEGMRRGRLGRRTRWTC